MSHNFAVKTMTKHPEGFFVAVVHSNYTQVEHTIHDRWGSWIVSSPDEAKFVGGSEPQKFGISPEYLQDYRKRHERKLKPYKQPTQRQSGNAFLAKKAKVNPMLAKKKNPMIKAKPNPMLAKKKKNPMLLKKAK